MAKLNFAQRFSADKQFRAAVEKIHLEAVLESAGIDPEALNAMYEAGVRPLTRTRNRRNRRLLLLRRKRQQPRRNLRNPRLTNAIYVLCRSC